MYITRMHHKRQKGEKENTDEKLATKTSIQGLTDGTNEADRGTDKIARKLQ